MTDPSPHAAAPLPNHFPWQTISMSTSLERGMEREIANQLDQLPAAVQAILPARDRERVQRILRIAYSAPHPEYYVYILEMHHESVDRIPRVITEIFDLIGRNEARLRAATTDAQRARILRRIGELRQLFDQQWVYVAQDIRDNLGLIEEHNRRVHEDSLRPEVQAFPAAIAQVARDGDWAQLRETLTLFPRYARYAPYGDLAQNLDRLAEALATHGIPAVPMRPMPLNANEPAMASNLIRQLHCLRGACALVHADPRATPPDPLPALAYGVEIDAEAFQALSGFEFQYLGGHMVRRARDRAWERVRERFALRLVSWARRYPESRLAALNGAPPEILLHIAAFVFPYTPYPN